MITDNFQKSSNFSDQQQVAAWWLSGIESVSVQGKKCMRIFCKEAQEQMWLKFTVELLVLWQLGILSSGPEVTLIFYICDPGFSPRDLDPKGLCSLVCKACSAQGQSFSEVTALLSSCLTSTHSQRLRRSWVMVQQNDLWLLSFWESGSAVGFCCTHAQTVGGVWLWARVNSSWSHPPRRPSCLSAGMAPFCG